MGNTRGASSQCEFNVRELGSYESTTISPGDPSRISVNYNGFCTANCNKIVFIQVVNRTAIFTDNWANKDNDTVDIGGQLFTVNYLQGEKDPYYNGDDRKVTRPELTKNLDGGAQGKHATEIVNSQMSDKPRYPDSVFRNIKNAHRGKEVKK